MRAQDLSPERGAWRAWHDETRPIRIGVSTCLLGESVRYDGGHKRDAFLVDVLGPFVEWVSVCPEVEVGMGVPRPTVQLVRDGDELRMVAPSSGEDFTARMNAFAKRRVAELKKHELDGYVLKKNSPSCGMARVKVHESGASSPSGKNGVGLFARALQDAWPHLPVEEEGRLADPVLRESFVERVFCRHRWRTLLAGKRTRARLVEFWTEHKMLVRAHDEAGYQRIGRIVGSARKGGDRELYERFESAFFAALAVKATRKKHANVLQHALGHLREALDTGERAQLVTAIDDYRKGLLPLVVPVTLLRFQIVKHRVEYLQGQLYFDPHPKELMLRNHV